jgi:hypothetical protein
MWSVSMSLTVCHPGGFCHLPRRPCGRPTLRSPDRSSCGRAASGVKMSPACGRCFPPGPRFGARVVAFHGAWIYVSVARPPRAAAHATHVALEHILTGADNLNDGSPFADYAASLVDARLWSFWWD